jgi:hypothetical protein
MRGWLEARLMRFRRAVTLPAMFMVAITGSHALGAGFSVACLDGDPRSTVQASRSTNTLSYCNRDVPDDGTCSFAFCHGSRCSTGSGCFAPCDLRKSRQHPRGAFSVSVGRTVQQRLEGVDLTLRCRRPLPCKGRCEKRTWTCTDGQPPLPTGGGDRDGVLCDADATQDGVCTFVVGQAQDVVEVPVGESRLLRRRPSPTTRKHEQDTLSCIPAPAPPEAAGR